MIDLHSHVLAGVDDGPATLDGSLALARAAVEAGTTQLVATPHVNWETHVSPHEVRARVAALQDLLDAEGVPLRLRTGGELSISRAVELSDEELTGLRLGGGEWLLAECPLQVSAASYDYALEQLLQRGHRIVLAHPERSPVVQRNPVRLRELVRMGMLTQITASSLTGAFGGVVQRFAFDLFEHGLVHTVASDAHGAVTRPPGLLEALERADGELAGLLDQAAWLTEEVPRAVLDGGPLPPFPPSRPRRRRRGLFRAAGLRR